ncbi:Amino acid transporter AVT1I [Glycine max]|nr:Amino acid transporter AVT1I [Glycine max]
MRLFTFKLESKLIARRRHHVTPSLRGSLVPLRRRHESSHFRFSDNDKSLPSSHRPKVRWKASSLPRRRSSQSRSRNRRKGHFVAGLHRSPFRERTHKILYEWEHNEFGLATDEEKVIALHPSTENIASFFGTCLNRLNAISSVGILSVPYALASEIRLSLAFLFAIATVVFYTYMLIKKCMDKYLNSRTYPDIGELAFGKIGRLIVSVPMYTKLYLVSIGFLILEANNLIWLDNLSLLSYVSASGVFAFTFIILSISWTATFDGVGFHQKVLLLCFLLTTMGCASMAMIGYLMFGADIESQITLNLLVNKENSKLAIYITLVRKFYCMYII